MSSKSKTRRAVTGATGPLSKTDGLDSDNTKAAASRKTFAAQKRWKQAHPKAAWAHAALRSGMRIGLVERGPCKVCGKAEVDGHHEDYSKPLEVTWLCRKHHRQLHARRGRE